MIYENGASDQNERIALTKSSVDKLKEMIYKERETKSIILTILRSLTKDLQELFYYYVKQ